MDEALSPLVPQRPKRPLEEPTAAVEVFQMAWHLQQAQLAYDCYLSWLPFTIDRTGRVRIGFE